MKTNQHVCSQWTEALHNGLPLQCGSCRWTTAWSHWGTGVQRPLSSPLSPIEGNPQVVILLICPVWVLSRLPWLQGWILRQSREPRVLERGDSSFRCHCRTPVWTLLIGVTGRINFPGPPASAHSPAERILSSHWSRDFNVYKGYCVLS